MQINIQQLYQEVAAELRTAELHAAELRGQLQMIERIIAQSQPAPIITSDNLGEENEP